MYIYIYINLGNKCNMNCTYCYENQNKGDREIKTEILDKIIEYCKKYPMLNITIGFFGGEPTLYKDKIIYVVENLYKSNNVTYSIATNGTNNEFINRLKEDYNINLKTIFSNKTNTKKDIYDDIKINQFNIILSPENISKINSDYLSSLVYKKNIESILVAYNLLGDWNTIDRKLIIDYLNNVNNFAILSRGKMKIINSLGCINESIKLYCPKRNELSINYNGDIYLCHRFFNSSEVDSSQIIGNLSTMSIQEAMKKINNSLVTCKTCGYIDYKNKIDNILYLQNIINESNIYIPYKLNDGGVVPLC